MRSSALHADLRVGDANQLDIADETMDLVVDVECTMGCTFSAASQLIANCYRILKPGGWLFSQTFSDETTVGSSFETIDRLTYRNIVGGHLARKRLLRLTSRSDIDLLYACFPSREVNTSSYTSDYETAQSVEWLIAARKELVN